MSTFTPCIYVVASAAPPVLRIAEFIGELTKRQWQVCVIATPTAASWIDLSELTATTGCLTRAELRGPYERDSLPRADVVAAVPLTFNTLNKWAAGISDTFALGILNEMLGADAPIIAAPCIKPVLQQHPAYPASLHRLTEAGVTMLDPDEITTRADDGLATFQWSHILRAITTHQF